MPVTRVPLGPMHGEVVVRHTEMVWGLNTVLFLHGLGDSRQCFMEAFEVDELLHYNLLAPDLPGSGNSPGGEELSISSLLTCIEGVLDHFLVSDFIVVGHGMGADLAVWLAQRFRGVMGCKAVVAVEGTIGEQNLLYADMAIEVADDPSRTYVKWFQSGFVEDTIMTPHMGKGQAWRRYYEALCMCKPWAFLALSREIRHALYKEDDELQAFSSFCDLEVPKYFCYAENGFCDAAKARELCEKAGVPHLHFAEATHWLMGDQPASFYSFLVGFVRKHMPQPTSAERINNWFRGRWMAWLDQMPKPIQSWREKMHHYYRTKVYLRVKRK